MWLQWYFLSHRLFCNETLLLPYQKLESMCPHHRSGFLLWFVLTKRGWQKWGCINLDSSTETTHDARKPRLASLTEKAHMEQHQATRYVSEPLLRLSSYQLDTTTRMMPVPVLWGKRTILPAKVFWIEGINRLLAKVWLILSSLSLKTHPIVSLHSLSL